MPTSASVASVKVEYVKSRKEVRVGWMLAEDTRVIGVTVFRSSDKVNFRPMTGLLKDTGFTDKEIEKGRTYYYQVRAYSNTGAVAQSDIQQTTITE